MKKLVILSLSLNVLLAAALVYGYLSSRSEQKTLVQRIETLDRKLIAINKADSRLTQELANSIKEKNIQIESLATRVFDLEDENTKRYISVSYSNGQSRNSDFIFSPAVAWRADFGEIFIGEFLPGSADVSDLDSLALVFLDSLMSRDDISSVQFLGTADKLRWHINGQTVNPLVHNSLNEIKKLERAENLNARYSGKANTGVKAGEYSRRGVLVSWYTLPKQPVEPTSGAVTFKAFELDSLPQQVAIPTAIMLVNRNVNQLTNGHNQSTVMDTLRAGQSLTFNNGVYSGLVFAGGYENQEKTFTVAGKSMTVAVYLKHSQLPTPPPLIIEVEPTDYFGYSYGTDRGFLGLGGLIEFPGNILVGGSFEGRDWGNGDREQGYEGYLGFRLPKIPIALIAGLRREAALDDRWEAWGPLIGGQVKLDIDRFFLVGQAGFRYLKVKEKQILGPLDFENLDGDPPSVGVSQLVIQHRREYWDADPFVRFGFGLRLNKSTGGK